MVPKNKEELLGEITKNFEKLYEDIDKIQKNILIKKIWNDV